MIARDGYCKSLWQGSSENYTSVHTTLPADVFDVVIVGGGITGVVTALQLQQAGKKCVLLEAHSLCFGTTGGTTAHINTLLDTSYADISKNFGKENAVLVARAVKQAVATIKENVEKYAIDCGFKEAAAYIFSQDEAQTKMLEDIRVSAVEAGINVNPVTGIPVPAAFEKAIRAEGQAQFNPLKYVWTLAAAFEKTGGVILQHCRVTGIHEKEMNEVETDAGIIKARNVILATHIPFGVNLLHLRCIPYRSYAMAVELEGENNITDLSYDLYDPYRYYRSQYENGINYLIAGGFDHKTGHEEDTARCFKELEAHVRSLFPVKNIAYRWSSQYFEPADGIPYIGHLPGHNESILVATGIGGNGMPYSHVAANILHNIILEKEDECIELFDPRRIKPVAGFTNFITHNLNAAAEWISTLFDGEKISQLAELAPGEGKIVKYEDQKIALYKDEQQRLHAVHPGCTHLKCSVQWNTAEHSWDCPCHGARFDADGNVLTGPASKDLDKINL